VKEKRLAIGVRCEHCKSPMKPGEQIEFESGQTQCEYVCDKHSLPIRVTVVTYPTEID
jgi:uncharacterized FAD-dependent dehydrogenase